MSVISILSTRIGPWPSRWCGKAVGFSVGISRRVITMWLLTPSSVSILASLTVGPMAACVFSNFANYRSV